METSLRAEWDTLFKKSYTLLYFTDYDNGNDNIFGQTDGSITMMMITSMLLFLRDRLIVLYSLPVSNLFY